MRVQFPPRALAIAHAVPASAANCHCAALGRNPPSQIQSAQASAQLTQWIGRFSFVPEDAVHVEVSSQFKFWSVGATVASPEGTRPGSYTVLASEDAPKSTGPEPAFTCVCLPERAVGNQPALDPLAD